MLAACVACFHYETGPCAYACVEPVFTVKQDLVLMLASSLFSL